MTPQLSLYKDVIYEFDSMGINIFHNVSSYLVFLMILIITQVSQTPDELLETSILGSFSVDLMP